MQPNMESLREFLSERLDLDDQVLDELGHVKLKWVYERKPKYKDEMVAVFEDKGIRDKIKAQGPALAKHKDEAGMRLQVPDHLQKAFRALMNLSYDIKNKQPNLKRNIKFEEDFLGLEMDIQISDGGDWRRIEAPQAIQANANRRTTVVNTIGMYVCMYVCCLLYTSPSPRDRQKSRMPSSA